MITQTRPPNMARLTLLISIFALIVIGCSTENPFTQKEPASSTAPRDENSLGELYPAISDEALETLIPGFEVLKVDERAFSNTLDDQNSRRIRRTVGGSVSHRNNGVEIGAWQLWGDQTITVSTPNPGSAVVDYYPHPYQFNGCVRIWIDLNVIQLPPGRRWDEIAFFYDEGDGTYTRYWGSLNLNNMTYSAWPDHFSRYILTLPTRNGN